MIRILLVEDDEALRGYLARALEIAGHEVVQSVDGDEALPLLGATRFDLLLTDVVMPGISGIELARECERVSPTTRIMLITGFAATVFAASCEAPQATVLSKPIHLRELVLEVERLFTPGIQKRG